MNDPLALLLLVVLSLVLIGPALGVAALIRLHTAERRRAGEQAALAARLAALERRLAALSAQGPAPAEGQASARAPGTPPVPSPVPAAGPPAAPPGARPPAPAPRGGAAPAPGGGVAQPPAAPPRAERPRFDLESLIASRWLNHLGITAVLLAVAFFLKYAFDNDWIGPRGRVGIGLLAGTGLIAASERFLRRGHRYFADGMAGLGGGVLYLSVFAAWSFYGLVPQTAAFAAMIAVTASLVVLALARSSQPLAVVALAGGFVTPMLLSTGQDAQVTLFSYLAVLDTGLLVIATRRGWRFLAPLALAWTALYFGEWYGRFYAPGRLASTAAFATLFFVLFAAGPLLRARAGRRLRGEEIGIVLANLSCFIVVLHLMLYADHRWALTGAVLLLAAAHLLALRLLPGAAGAVGKTGAGPEAPEDVGDRLARILFAGLALTLVTLAVPIRLEGKWIVMTWAVEGAVLVWSGARQDVRLLRAAGLVLLALAAIQLVRPIEAHRLLLNARFATFAVVAGSLGAAWRFSREPRGALPADEKPLFGVAGLAANALAVTALSLEVWDFGSRSTESGLARQLGLSLLWTACAGGLIAAGLIRSSPALRWQGLALIGLTTAKVFLFDLSFLQRTYRILSFLALGIVLLVVSFFYQRRLAAGRAGEGG